MNSKKQHGSIENRLLAFFSEKNFEKSRRFNSNYKYSPDSLKLLLKALGNPHKNHQFIHIAGTNAKGSVTHYLSRMLLKAGKQVFTFTSPHLLSIHERFLFNNEPIEEELLASLFETLEPYLSKHQVSFFDALTALFFMFINHIQEQVNLAHESVYAVIETGLGGRLDSTNVIDSLFSVITFIGLDHQKILGNSVTQIAREKAGIIKNGHQVFIAEQPEEVIQVFREEAASKHATLNILPDKISRVNDSSLQQYSTIQKEISLIEESQHDYRYRNLVFAAGIYQHFFKKAALPIDLQLRGRLEYLNLSEPVIFDSAHNAPAIEQLLYYIQKIRAGYRVQLVFNFLVDRDLQKLVSQIEHTFTFKPQDTVSIFNLEDPMFHNVDTYSNLKTSIKLNKFSEKDLSNKTSLTVFFGSMKLYGHALNIINRANLSF